MVQNVHVKNPGRLPKLAVTAGVYEEGDGARQAVLLEGFKWKRTSASLVAGKKTVALTCPRSARHRSRPTSGPNSDPGAEIPDTGRRPAIAFSSTFSP